MINVFVKYWHGFRSYMISATPTQRVLVAVFASTPFILLCMFVQSIGLFVSEWRELMRPEKIILTNWLQVALLATQWYILWKLWPHRFEHRSISFESRLIAVLIYLSFALEALLGGNLTFPTCMMIVCLIPIGLMILDFSSVLVAFCFGMLFLMFNDYLLFSGLVDYAPGYSPNAFANGKHHVMAELLRTSCVYLNLFFYALIFWLLFEQQEYHRKLLREAAHRDPLTSIFNRRYFMEQLEALCRNQQATGVPMCVTLIDADHFKKINDSYGHPEGDRVLKAIAAVLQDNMRNEADIIGRVGGEEFAIVFPNTNKAGALAVCERIQKALAEQSFGQGCRKFKVTLSMGLVESLYVDMETLLHQVDELLYQAKSEGRNQVVAKEVMDLPDHGSEYIGQGKKGQITLPKPVATVV